MSFCGLFFLRVRAAMSERWTCWVFTEWGHFQGVYSAVSIGEGLIFSLHALLVKIHKPPRANLTAVPLLLSFFFSKNSSSKVTKKKKKKQRPYANWLRQGWHLDYCREKNQHYLSLIYFTTEKLFTGYKRSISHTF